MYKYVRVSFMHQPDGAKGCPGSWCNIRSGCVCEVFLEEISIWMDWPHGERWSSWMKVDIIHLLGAEFKKKMEERWIYSLCLSWDTHLLLPLNDNAPGSWAFGLRPELIRSASWFSGIQTQAQLHDCLSQFSSLKIAGYGTSQPP